MTTHRPHPITLIILDGWGYREDTEANAIAAANKPNWDHLWKTCPHTLLSGSGPCVGLPAGQMGNSEVGHLNMGAGRIVYQDFSRIDLAIQDGDFFKNQTLLNALQQAKSNKKAVHIMGLLSPGGVHSHEQHIYALLKLAAAQQTTDVYLHVFLDGRDTPPRSAMASIESLDTLCKSLSCGQIVSIVGRYYAMDRDNRWDRIQKAYDLLVQGKSNYQADTAREGLLLAYERGENDEFVMPTSIHTKDSPPISINDGDSVIFMNFRADRARQITRVFTERDFNGFKREKWPQLGSFTCLSEYDARFALPVAFQPQALNHIFAQVISELGLKQLRIAETEKYAHVTFFFNGGVEAPYPGEDRILIPSPNVATYDLQPEMSAKELTTQLVDKILSKQYDVIICNFANPDMVGHTGNFAATVQAIETIDVCLGSIVKALKETGGELLITADHGNAEKMFDSKTNQAHTSHTTDPVPFIYVGRAAEIDAENGKLSDIAPTLLYLLGIPQPQEMTGKKLVNLA
jgi:2,3-bisphosphoglycerate-independent phosphoglycerate mutase